MDEIFVNSIIEWCDEANKVEKTERILWISPKKEEVVVIKIGEEKLYMPEITSYQEIIDALKTPYVRKLKSDPYTHLFNLNGQYLIKHIPRRDEAWDVIKDIVELEPDIYIKEIRGELIKDLLQRTKFRKKWIYDKLKKYWTYGQSKNSLIPMYMLCGGPGKEKELKEKKIGRPPNKSKFNGKLVGVNVTGGDKKIFKAAIRLYYEKADKPDLRHTYDEMIKNFYHEGYHMKNGVKSPILPDSNEVPTIAQFRYWFDKEYNPKDKTLMKYGEKEYKLKKRPLIGNTVKRASGPGAIYEIDATIADVYLVSSLARNRIIGRPIVYIVKDVFSRMVAGVYVGLEGPSWLGAMMVLENATTDKKQYCKQLGIEISEQEWPIYHLPTSIVADRGEMEGNIANNLINDLGIRIENTPPYRADLKGIVEQHFRTINTKIKRWLPGAVHKDFKQRGGKDYRLDGKLTLKSFEKIIVLSILEHNQKLINNYPMSGDMIEDNVLATPIELWTWGIKSRYGHLKETDRDRVRFALMPRDNASIRRKGIYFKKNYYSSDYALEKGWYENASEKGSQKVEVFYDPRDINYIFLKKENGKFGKCELINRYFEKDEVQPRLEDLLEYYDEMHIKNELTLANQKQVSSDINTQIEEIVKEETKKTNQSLLPNQSKRSKIKDIRKNRKIEKEYQKEKEAWKDTLKSNKQQKPAEVIQIDIKNEKIEPEADTTFDILFNLGQEKGE